MQLSDLTQEQLDAVGREVCRRKRLGHISTFRQGNKVHVDGLHLSPNWAKRPRHYTLFAWQALAILAELEEQDATL